MRVDKNGDLFSNFFSNFFSQLKNPTNFSFFKIPAPLAIDTAKEIQKQVNHPTPEGEQLMKEHQVKVEPQQEQKEILIQIKDFEDRLSHMRDLLATRQIDAEDYREIKSQYNLKISVFESQLTTLNNDVSNVQILIDQGLSKIMEINHNLENGSLMEIREDIGSIYPEKMQFEKTGVRTTRRNDFIQYINLINKKLGAKKTGQK